MVWGNALPTIGVNNIHGPIQRLASSDAENVLVVNCPDLSQPPPILGSVTLYGWSRKLREWVRRSLAPLA